MYAIIKLKKGEMYLKENNIFKELYNIENYKADESPDKTNELYNRINEHVNVLYDFVLTYSDYMNTKKDYGSGENLTMNEAHVLTDIADNPGITVTELSKLWGKTTSALSQTVRKLINRELIYRVNSKEDAKVFMLYPTQRAIEFSLAHKRYDILDIIKTTKRLMRKFTDEELMIFHNVMEEYTKLLEQRKNKNKEHGQK